VNFAKKMRKFQRIFNQILYKNAGMEISERNKQHIDMLNKTNREILINQTIFIGIEEGFHHA